MESFSSFPRSRRSAWTICLQRRCPCSIVSLEESPHEVNMFHSESSGTAAPQLPMNEDDPSRPLEHSDVRHDANWNLEFVRNGQDQNQNQG
ncbi:hypothetical protein L596_002499 [Steinernema carpocapsae]|uniref:Uncharacterized protein n=1 Tax=Steinernema carpocapsae TaxID=34508 RepID=A0A4U8US93_STECR|nr:hypothetical protein L596_002499 [Steinernema carpocapsae]